jgi:DNA-directed RNA polymerase subunit N (RpoN/RPB10)
MTIAIRCRNCGARISGDFTRGDTFPARNVDSETGEEREAFLICRACHDDREERHG